jgi:hypothetical protein
MYIYLLNSAYKKTPNMSKHENPTLDAHAAKRIHIAAGNRVKPRTPCPSCKEELICKWGEVRTVPFWSHKPDKTSHRKCKLSGESLQHAMTKQMICSFLSTYGADALVFKHKHTKCACVDTMIIPACAVKFEEEVSQTTSGERVIWDIACKDASGCIVFGIEVFHTHKTNNYTGREGVPWAEIRTSDPCIVEILSEAFIYLEPMVAKNVKHMPNCTSPYCNPEDSFCELIHTGAKIQVSAVCAACGDETQCIDICNREYIATYKVRTESNLSSYINISLDKKTVFIFFFLHPWQKEGRVSSNGVTTISIHRTRIEYAIKHALGPIKIEMKVPTNECFSVKCLPVVDEFSSIVYTLKHMISEYKCDRVEYSIECTACKNRTTEHMHIGADTPIVLVNGQYRSYTASTIYIFESRLEHLRAPAVCFTEGCVRKTFTSAKQTGKLDLKADMVFLRAGHICVACAPKPTHIQPPPVPSTLTRTSTKRAKEVHIKQPEQIIIDEFNRHPEFESLSDYTPLTRWQYILDHDMVLEIDLFAARLRANAALDALIAGKNGWGIFMLIKDILEFKPRLTVINK